MERKPLDKIQCPFMIKALKKLGVEGSYFNIRKTMQTYSQHYTEWRKMESNSLKSDKRQGCSLAPLLFNIVLDSLSGGIKQENEINGYKYGRKKSNYPCLQII
jgi:hypothetical protein